MLHVDKNEIVTGGLGDAGDVAGARDAHIEAERDLAGLHPLLDRVRQHVVAGRGHFHPLFSSVRCRE